jgi:hypothetical protein
MDCATSISDGVGDLRSLRGLAHDKEGSSLEVGGAVTKVAMLRINVRKM